MDTAQSPALRPKQAAAFLGISPPTLWRWVKDRKTEDFPQPRKLGPRTTVFVQAELTEFLEKAKQSGDKAS